MTSALRSTKLIATIGPACESEASVRELIQAGMNVARINFSHGDHDAHRRIAERVRRIAAELGANIALLGDTRGAEVRTGELTAPSVVLREGQPFELFTDARIGDADGVSVSHAALPRAVAVGSRILLDDGRLALEVTATERGRIRTTVVRGGELGPRKGVNVPGVDLGLSAVSAQDVDDLRLAAELGLDYLAASFVRKPSDVISIREIVRAHGAEIPIVAKIENAEAVAELDAIIEVADGTMVARGDLGVELPVEQVPLIQKRIIRSTVRAGKPVITATQMLDSMERNPRPTRAEASDVANAIFDGTSAVMLSGETARGAYPIEAVRTMASIAKTAEAAIAEYGDLQRALPEPADPLADAVAHAAYDIARRAHASAILTLTESGRTSRSISRLRPACPILAVTASEVVVRRLALNWGVTALLHPGHGSDDERVRFGVERARELCAKPGDAVVVTAGISGESGSTNLIRVVQVS